MRVSSFTPAQVLSVIGPTGRIDGPQVFPSTGIAKTFSFNGPFLLIPKSGTLTSTILISSTGLNVSNLSVKVNITDPNDASLALTLVAPDGTMVPLVAAGSASGANFTNTTFSDAPAANGLSLSIPTAPAGSGAPYSLTYKPASPLATLAGKAIDGTWKLLVSDSTANGAQGRLNAWSLNITPQVPQGVGTRLDSSLVISSFPDNSFTIAHLAVQVNISATVDGQLQVLLIAPDGTLIPLALHNGGSGSNFTNTVFDDNATIPIGQGTAPFSLSYKPAAKSLSLLNGKSLEGTWKLRIIDDTIDSSVTTLNSWSLIATPRLTVTPVNPVNGAARTFTVGFPTQQLSGTYNITLSPNILSVTPNPANTSVGTPLDTNLNAGVDALRGVSSGATTSDKFAATAVPVPIPYAQKTPLGSTPGVLTSQINVTDNFAIQGDVGTLAGLTVSFNIVYYNDPDLSATLTAPNGKSVTLFMNVGKGNTTANFTNTTLSDTITPPAPISAAG
jgi:subtilisin-like proprotein convertase family protein